MTPRTPAATGWFEYNFGSAWERPGREEKKQPGGEPARLDTSIDATTCCALQPL